MDKKHTENAEESPGRPPPFCPYDEARMQVIETKMDYVCTKLDETREQLEKLDDRLNGPFQELLMSQADEIVEALLARMETETAQDHDLAVEKLKKELKQKKQEQETKVEKWKIIAAILTGLAASPLIQLFL